MRAFRFPGLLFPAFLGLATACLSTEPDNLPPIVTIIQPENRHVVDVGEVVEIVVEASAQTWHDLMIRYVLPSVRADSTALYSCCKATIGSTLAARRAGR